MSEKRKEVVARDVLYSVFQLHRLLNGDVELISFKLTHVKYRNKWRFEFKVLHNGSVHKTIFMY